MAVTQLSPSASFLHVVPMEARQIAQSLPLAQSIRSDLTLCEWRDFCESMLSCPDDRAGMECVVDDNGYLLGIMAYRCEPNLHHKKVLTVDPFVAVDLYGRDEAERRLLARAEEIAEMRGCAAVHIAVDRTDRAIQPGLAGFSPQGYRVDGIRFCKTVPLSAAS